MLKFRSPLYRPSQAEVAKPQLIAPRGHAGEYLTELGQKSDIAATIAGNVTVPGRLVVPNSCRVLLGWCVCEQSGSAAVKFRIRDGDANGAVFCTVTIAQGASAVPVFLGDQALICNTGKLFLEITTGTLEGAIWWG